MLVREKLNGQVSKIINIYLKTIEGKALMAMILAKSIQSKITSRSLYFRGNIRQFLQNNVKKWAFLFSTSISLSDMLCEFYLVRVNRYPICPSFRQYLIREGEKCLFIICIAR